MNLESVLTLMITNGVTLLVGIYTVRKKFQSNEHNNKFENNVKREGIYAEHMDDVWKRLGKVEEERSKLDTKVKELQVTIDQQSNIIDAQTEQIGDQNKIINKQTKKIDKLTESINKLMSLIKEKEIVLNEESQTEF